MPYDLFLTDGALMSFRTESIEVGTTAPTFPEVDDIWVDTSGDLPSLKVYDGKRWESIGGGTGDTSTTMGFVHHGGDAGVERPDYGSVTWRGTVEPVNMLDVDLWVDIS